MKITKFTKFAAIGAIGALAMTGCAAAAPTGAQDQAEPIKIAVFNGWDEGVAVSELWKAVLEEKGIPVELEYADAAPVFEGLSTGDYDVTMDVWLPLTHADYLERYGDDIEKIGVWNDEAALTIAVNEDSPITSLEELAANAKTFGNRIVGIEPGAGLTTATQESVIPQYGLEDMEYVTSSTPAMLSELKAATKNNEDIVVTLWRPHWAYDAFPMRDLEDPKGALGDAEELNIFGSSAFSADHPEVAGWLEGFTMDSELLFSLENAMFNEADTDNYGEIVATWISENREWVDTLTQ